MSLQINPVNFKSSIPDRSVQPDKNQDKPDINKKVLMGGLAALGVTALAITLLKKKKRLNNNQTAKDIIKENCKTTNMSEEEKEKLIRKLQEKTDNPDVKEEIRKLVESGEWDKL